MRGFLARLLARPLPGRGRSETPDAAPASAGAIGDPALPAPEAYLAELLAMPMPEWTGAGGSSVAQCLLSVAQLERNERHSRMALARAGLKVWTSSWDRETYLAIANKPNGGICLLLKGSRLGASNWPLLLRTIQGARPMSGTEGPMSIGGIVTRVTLIPIATAVEVALHVSPPPRPHDFRKIDLLKPFYAFQSVKRSVKPSVKG